MAVGLLGHEVSDLCLGKPALKFLPISATVADALLALKRTEDNFISVWSCNHHNSQAKNPFRDGGDKEEEEVEEEEEEEECRCVGKVCMVNVICYLGKDENLLSPSTALDSPISVLLPMIPDLVMHVEPHSSLMEAIDLILEGAQNLVVPIQTRNNPFSRKRYNQKLSTTGLTMHTGREFCWLTQEDILRYFLSSIGLFSRIASVSIDTLGIITADVLSVNYHSPASAAIGAISQSLTDQTSVAVVDEYGSLIGEISPFTLSCCDETVAAAIATLSVGELMSYIDCGGPPDDLVRVVKSRLKERNLEKLCEEFTNCDFSGNLSNSLHSCTSSSSSSSSSSSDDESTVGYPKSPSSPTTTLVKSRSRKYSRSMSYSARMVRRAEAIVCCRGSSLVAVMIQAIAHRVNYVWVIEDDCSLIGIVTFSNMVNVLREHLQSIAHY